MTGDASVFVAQVRPSRTFVLALLTQQPRRFGFDAMMRIFMHGRRQDDPAAAVRFRTPPGLTFPEGDVLEVRRGGKRADVTIRLMGLSGPFGLAPLSLRNRVATAAWRLHRAASVP